MQAEEQEEWMCVECHSSYFDRTSVFHLSITRSNNQSQEMSAPLSISLPLDQTEPT
jgi:hypothetical protein